MILHLIDEIHLNNSIHPVHMMDHHIRVIMEIEKVTIGMIHGIGKREIGGFSSF